MRYRLRTLCVLLAICPPVLAYAWSLEQQYLQWLAQQAELRKPQAAAPRQLQLNVSARPAAQPTTTVFDDSTKSFTIGWTSSGPTADLDLAFNQGMFPER